MTGAPVPYSGGSANRSPPSRIPPAAGRSQDGPRQRMSHRRRVVWKIRLNNAPTTPTTSPAAAMSGYEAEPGALGGGSTSATRPGSNPATRSPIAPATPAAANQARRNLGKISSVTKNGAASGACSTAANPPAAPALTSKGNRG